MKKKQLDKTPDLKEQEVLASLKAELEGKSGADILNETIIRTIEEPRKIEEAEQQAKQELWDELEAKGFVKQIKKHKFWDMCNCSECANDRLIEEIKKRHNLR